MAKIGEKLRQYFENQGIKQVDIASAIGVNPSYITKIYKGEREIGKEQVDKWVTHYGLSKVWLLTGEGEMLQSGADSTETTDVANKIPLLPVSAQGGSLNDFVVSVKESDCERIISPIKDAEYAMSVSGDSMSPEYPSGSQILIKRINEKAFIDWGRTYVLDTCNGTVIKRLFPTESKDRVICKSINPEYPPFEVCLADVYGVYRVLMCMSLK